MRSTTGSPSRRGQRRWGRVRGDGQRRLLGVRVAPAATGSEFLSASPTGSAQRVLFCPREKRLFSLKGKTNKEKRMKIYKFLLEHFTDEQRFNITSKICLSILGRQDQPVWRMRRV